MCASAGQLAELKHPNRTTLYLLYTSLSTGELNAIRKQNALSAVLSREGRVVGLYWENKKLKDLKEGQVSRWSDASGHGKIPLVREISLGKPQLLLSKEESARKVSNTFT